MEIRENNITAKEYNYLFDKIGWGSYDSKVSKIALENSLYTVSVYDNNEIIGFGRLIGDGSCYFYIHDVIVLPKYQNKGIGKLIVEKLITKVKKYRKLIRI